MTSRLRHRAALLLVASIVVAAGAPAAAGGRGERAGTCFGKPGTIWATAGASTSGTPGADVIIGSPGNDIVWAGKGNDLICGNGGHDLLFGEEGRDRIQGGPGSDVLYGGEGRDSLAGGPGANILNGGLSVDRCLGGDTYVSCELPAVDKILTACPTAREIAQIDEEFDLVFDNDPTAYLIACTGGGGRPYLSPLQKRAYNALLVMDRIPFDAALPWTPYSLGEWFARSISTIHFKAGIDYSHYGPEPGVIWIQTGMSILDLPASQATDRWLRPDGVIGLSDLMILMVHEARHAQLLHNCHPEPGVGNTWDTTADYLGAWGVQYYLDALLAEHVAAAFLTDPTGDRALYRGRHALNAGTLLATRFCGP